MSRGFNGAPTRARRPANAKSEALAAFGIPRAPLPADLPGTCRTPACGSSHPEPAPAGWARVQVLGRRPSARVWCSSQCASYALAHPTRRAVGGPGTCQQQECGTAQADAVDTSGWIRTQVIDSTDGVRFWCSGLCAVYGLALAELRMEVLADA
ncbi:hypothetical protein JHN55_31645 [Streptomyces sp. MBT56]|uniref:hypothetical protein n=1 Tax=unclassified Streptomyces TaxID=2593676 RepID=UPI00190CCBC6|nr:MULTISPECIES: hypothetical protein [unclassified Streptomyces]MBK3561007.1 hypothetical protein [Streptomyces sp. MBT56]MBK3605619.1 hypothetical protein [Streptomyces sp. MBT54]MBK3619918.1 hypothetical protein [Streptomyces sp. MBT98]MBK6045732.1 hypothetical protein [Streptomyces sp. MBT55]